MPHKIDRTIFTVFIVLIFISLSAYGFAEQYTHEIKLTKFDKPTADEKNNINQIANAQRKLQTLRYSQLNARKLRNVHPKAHGCVNAKFTINKDIRKELQVGLFSKPGYTYEDVKIRYSNATTSVTDDINNSRATSRGMAIQISGVEKILEKRTLPVPRRTGAQDFLMINQPTFAFKNVEDYLEITKLQIDELNGKVPNAVLTFLGFNQEGKPTKHFREAQIIGVLSSAHIANPLEVQYFSAAPFLFGNNQVMKFSAKPCSETPQVAPSNPSPDYLRQAMKKSLSEGEACFDFLVQVPPIPDGNFSEILGLEDATFEWIDKQTHLADFPGKSKNGIPYVKVAQITISKQNFDTRANDEACENLELSPWHSLEQHQPVGSINRLRNPIYSESAKGRKNRMDQRKVK